MKSLTITHKDLDKAITESRTRNHMMSCVIAQAARRTTRNIVLVGNKIAVFKKNRGFSRFSTGDPVFRQIIEWFDRNETDKIRALLPVTIHGFVKEK